MIESTFGAKFIAWVVGLIPALLGSAISLTLQSEAPKPTTWKDYAQLIVTFASGVTIAQVSGNAILEHWQQLTADSAIFFMIKFAIGLYGMRGAATFYMQIPEWLVAIRNKFIGN